MADAMEKDVSQPNNTRLNNPRVSQAEAEIAQVSCIRALYAYLMSFVPAGSGSEAA